MTQVFFNIIALKCLSKCTEIVNNLQIFFTKCFTYLTYGKHNKGLSDYCVLKHGLNEVFSIVTHIYGITHFSVD